MRSTSLLILSLIFACCKLSASDTLIIKFNQKDVRQSITKESGRPKSSKFARSAETVYVFAAKVAESDTSTQLTSYRILFNTEKINTVKTWDITTCYDRYPQIHLSDIKTVYDFEYLRRTMFKKTILLIDEAQSEKMRKAVIVYPMFLEPIGKDVKIQF